MNKTITIFGSSLPSEGSDQYELAYELGKKLALNGFNICTGGYKGIMEAASRGAYDNGGMIYAVTIDLWNSQPNPFITIEVRGKTLFERVEKLIELGDAYVILQGGTGTFLEFAAVWEYANKNLQNKKPIYYHSWLWKQIVDLMDKQMLLEGRDANLVRNFNSVDELIDRLKKDFNL